MKLTACLGLSFLCLNIAAPAWAQSLEDTPPVSPPSTSATDLTIAPRFGGSVSTSGSGTPRFSRLDALVPVWQDPGASLTFVEAHLLWLDYETLGTNLVVGQRFFEAESDRIWGGYIAYDTRDTGNNQFHQIGLGLEHLSDTWDARFNSSFPVGDAEQLIASSPSLGASNLRFVGNSLLFDETRLFEVALLTIEGEAGGKLVELGNFGELHGYGGLYWLDGGNTSVLGWRARLEARAQERYTLDLSVQDDDRFGTNVVLRAGISFGGVPQAVPREEVPPTYLRFGDFVARNSTIVIDEQTQLVATIARNPVTGEPWVFQHVGNTGGSEGDGTFENPFGTIAAGVNASGSNGTDNRNEIVYVQFGSNPTQTSAITIPENIQILSVAPIQTITTQLGTVQLPLSGTGQRPQINATVTMGNSTVLSGFSIAGVAGNGIDARNKTGFTIRDNTISNVTQFGIFGGANNGSTVGNIRIENNTFNTVGNAAPRYDAIFFGVDAGSTLQNLIITNNTIANAGNDGIGVGARAGSTLTNVTIANNSISTVGRFGIGVGTDTAVTPLGLPASNNSRIANVTITNNSISNAGQSSKSSTGMLPGASIGIAVQANNSRACFSASGNTSIAPNNLFGGVANLDLYLQNTGGVADNLQIINRGTLGTSNSGFDVICVFTPSPSMLPSLTQDVASCP